MHAHEASLLFIQRAIALDIRGYWLARCWEGEMLNTKEAGTGSSSFWRKLWINLVR